MRVAVYEDKSGNMFFRPGACWGYWKHGDVKFYIRSELEAWLKGQGFKLVGYEHEEDCR